MHIRLERRGICFGLMLRSALLKSSFPICIIILVAVSLPARARDAGSPTDGTAAGMVEGLNDITCENDARIEKDSVVQLKELPHGPEGTSRVLYLVGLELPDHRAPVWSALQLASTASYFIHGPGSVKDAAIRSFSLRKGLTFGIRMKVYPAIPLKSQQSDEDGIATPLKEHPRDWWATLTLPGTLCPVCSLHNKCSRTLDYVQCRGRL